MEANRKKVSVYSHVYASASCRLRRSCVCCGTPWSALLATLALLFSESLSRLLPDEKSLLEKEQKKRCNVLIGQASACPSLGYDRIAARERMQHRSSRPGSAGKSGRHGAALCICHGVSFLGSGISEKDMVD